MAFIILILIYLCLQGFDEFFIFFKSIFPLDRAFEHEAAHGIGFWKKMQWWIMVLFLCYDVFFIAMTLLWLLLGAIMYDALPARISALSVLPRSPASTHSKHFVRLTPRLPWLGALTLASTTTSWRAAPGAKSCSPKMHLLCC